MTTLKAVARLTEKVTSELIPEEGEEMDQVAILRGER